VPGIGTKVIALLTRIMPRALMLALVNYLQRDPRRGA
jgi:hypothetical protein